MRYVPIANIELLENEESVAYSKADLTQCPPALITNSLANGHSTLCSTFVIVSHAVHLYLSNIPW